MARMTKEQVSYLDDLVFNEATRLEDHTSFQITAHSVARLLVFVTTG